MDVSIIIVNYNTSSLINDCIKSIFSNTIGIEYEIIIVDNATEDLSTVIEPKEDPRIVCIQLPENIGFGRANNAGFRVARGRNLFCLNPDTILLNNAVKILSDFLDANPDAGACGGNLYDVDMHPTHSFSRCFPGIFMELNQFFIGFLAKIRYGKSYMFNYSNDTIEVAYITGADLMIRKSIIEQAGGFDSDFFMYYEETELQYRISSLGYKIISVPWAKTIHLEGKSFSIPENKEKEALISRDLFFKKTRSKTMYLLVNFNFRLTLMIAYIIANLFKLRNYQTKLRQRINIINGIYR